MYIILAAHRILPIFCQPFIPAAFNCQAQVLSAVSLSRYLVSDLWLTSSLQVLGMVRHSELYSTVFICDHSFLRFLQRAQTIKFIIIFPLMSITNALSSCSQPRQIVSLMLHPFLNETGEATNVSTDSFR